MESRLYQGQALRVCAVRPALTEPNLHAHPESGKGDGAARCPPLSPPAGLRAGAYFQRSAHKFSGRGFKPNIDSQETLQKAHYIRYRSMNAQLRLRKNYLEFLLQSNCAPMVRYPPGQNLFITSCAHAAL